MQAEEISRVSAVHRVGGDRERDFFSLLSFAGSPVQPSRTNQRKEESFIIIKAILEKRKKETSPNYNSNNPDDKKRTLLCKCKGLKSRGTTKNNNKNNKNEGAREFICLSPVNL